MFLCWYLRLNWKTTVLFLINLPFRLCPALKSIFQHGMRKPSILGGPCHPWLFVEEVMTLKRNDYKVNIV